MVLDAGTDPAASAVSGQHSSGELIEREFTPPQRRVGSGLRAAPPCWYPLAGSSRVLPACKTGAFPSGSGGVKWCPTGDSNPDMSDF